MLDVAYNTPFIGNAATDFVNFLLRTDEDIRFNNLAIYTKAISVIQSSGTGKSRMLTEVRSCSTARYHLTQLLIGWQPNLYASHLSPQSTFSRLPTV